MNEITGGSAEEEERAEQFFTDLIFTKLGRPRFTQDSPILPDVLIQYGKSKEKALDLLITPDWNKTPGQLATELGVWLGLDSHDDANLSQKEKNERTMEKDNLQLAYNESVVAVSLSFENIVCNLLPLSWWWQKKLIATGGLDPVSACANPDLKRVIKEELLEGLRLEIKKHGTQEVDTRHWIIKQELAWAARLFWHIQHYRVGQPDEPEDDLQEIADYFIDHLIEKKITKRQEKLKKSEETTSPPRKSWIYSINCNRKIDYSVFNSVVATKADAAVRTFDVKGRNICWAIVDTGIDARHIAFREKQADGTPYDEAFGADDSDHTRIKATYDFSDIRSHLSKDQLRSLKSQSGRLLDWEKLEEQIEKQNKKHREEHPEEPRKPGFRIPHDVNDYRTPLNAHGTHVAGILAADWSPDADGGDPLGPPPVEHGAEKTMQGMCPEIELYDLRVFKDDGSGDEFSIMSALQFVRSLNQRHDTIKVHGVNLSLAMQHDVRNYACGRSPVCEECTRLVGNGVVVVAAAGNEGRSIHTTTQGRSQEGYRAVSIADPGNTEDVITVGSTHRMEPHKYGVSYFSSRGPTGDGRLKPDLVAPGEKIFSTVPGDRIARMDGTSQAAPHVSGAAALLMCRHTEMIGQPLRIKEVLMETATNLGRERDFQGAGLVDIMRAMQRL